MNESMKEKREALKALSKLIQQLVKSGQYESVNEGLADTYRQQGHEEIHSFKGWMERGFVVKRGEKALLLWGKPHTAQKHEKKNETDKDEFSFFPLAYVFSNLQVEPLKELAR